RDLGGRRILQTHGETPVVDPGIERVTFELLGVALELERIPRAVGVVGSEHRLVARRGLAGERHREGQRRPQVAQLLQKPKTQIPMPAAPAVLKDWRKATRDRLIAARTALSAEQLESMRRRIDGHLELSFPGLARCRLAFCWPIKGEYDARHFARTLRDRGALTALPVVVAPKQPLIFREWHPGVQLVRGPLNISYPVGSAELQPDAVLLPMNGWDAQGYRLGYGAGFFDRTLAS